VADAHPRIVGKRRRFAYYIHKLSEEQRGAGMKTLILCVDRDDDIGSKAEVETPIVGRRRIVDAATALGLADPEDSDTNSLFAGAHLYDKELRRATEQGRQLEVAAITGHRSMGLRGDRKLARELDEVLELTRADEVILVSDGAEDEQILPILQSRVKVAHVHRTIVRQAPRLEGFYYVLTRIMDDKKFARRYILPIGIVTLAWSLAILFNLANYAWGVTLGIVGAWLIIHAMHWEDRLSTFFKDLLEGLRSGKVSLLANIVMMILLVFGAIQSYGKLPPELEHAPWNVSEPTLQALFFLSDFLYYLVGALLIRTAGVLFDDWIRTGQGNLRHWTTAFTLVAFGLIAGAVLTASIDIKEQAPLDRIVTFDLVVQLIAGLAVAMGGFLLARYVRSYFEEQASR
jgi:putative membrane protein